MGLFVGFNDSGTMACGVVIHKDEVLGWVSLLEEQGDVTQNFIFVLAGGHDAFDVLQGDLMVVREACLHHDGSSIL